MKKRIEYVEPGEWVLTGKGWLESIGNTYEEDDLDPSVVFWGNNLERSTKIWHFRPGEVVEVRSSHPHEGAEEELVECPVCEPLEDDATCLTCLGMRFVDVATAKHLAAVSGCMWVLSGATLWPIGG